jgi:hypothetical protein
MVSWPSFIAIPTPECAVLKLPLLLPAPRKLSLANEALLLRDHLLIILEGPDPAALLFSARRLQAALQASAGLSWEIGASPAAPASEIGVTLSVVPAGVRHPQGYELTITPEDIRVVACTAAGVFYAVCTLIQTLESSLQPSTSDLRLPTLRISDSPDYSARAVMLDISRDRVPTMATLYDLIDLLASWKVNQLQLYTEHTFAYRNHPEVWAEASPLTGEEILALDAFCRERFIELVPNQNSFGHMAPWLKLRHYQPLAETTGEWTTPWGETQHGGFSLCPGDPGSLDLVAGLYDELLPYFTSGMLNVGCDETWDLGQGRSAAACRAVGRGRVYLDFLLKIYREVQARGRTMQYWGDIILQHPELIGDLPRDTIALAWGYEADHPFGAHGEQFAAAGVPFYVCPGTGSWRTLAGRTSSILGNLGNAAENGLRHGAIGFLNTDWGDEGHWQPLPVSYLGFAYGAAVSWGRDAARALDLPQALSRYAFGDPSGVLGRIAFDLGNAYQESGVALFNATVFFQVLHEPGPRIIAIEGLNAAGLGRALAAVDAVMARWPASRSRRPDAALVAREYAWVADMMRHACRRGLWALAGARPGTTDAAALAEDAARLIGEYRDLWLARCRPGGLADSAGRLVRMRQDYLAV